MFLGLWPLKYKEVKKYLLFTNTRPYLEDNMKFIYFLKD